MKILIAILIVLSLSACFGKKPSLETGHEGKLMPSMNLLLMDSATHINMKKISLDKAIVLFYFSPYCPYCRTLTKNILKDIKNLDSINFFLISDFPFAEVNKFNNEYKLNNYSNITTALDYEKYFGQYFKAPGFPCIAIYGKDQKLRQVLMGTVSTSLIKDIALE